MAWGGPGAASDVSRRDAGVAVPHDVVALTRAPAHADDGLTADTQLLQRPRGRCAPSTSGGPVMRARLAGVTKTYGAQIVLEHASLEVGPRARLGLVGPNGVGKSTVLRLLAGEEMPDRGAVTVDPPHAAVADLSQEVHRLGGDTLGGRPARLAGVAVAERDLEAAAQALACGADGSARDEPRQSASDRYDEALTRFLALGGGDLDARAATVCAQLGLGVELDRPFAALSGGEAAGGSLGAGTR